VGKSQHLQGCFLVLIRRKSYINLIIPVLKLSCDKVPSSVILSTSKMIHLLWVLLSGSGIYMAIYVIRRIIFAQNGKNLLRNINDSIETTGKRHTL
jgi:hypothetical protein